ncbi:MAG: tetratricopeptide repeat protein [Phycisphaerales bacterium]|jgi:cytochrome c-type biogenesis protein CcmH/NrfG|nr:tetratricopeptide repeat protein [Phycisphaeraceae bacterium]
MEAPTNTNQPMSTVPATSSAAPASAGRRVGVIALVVVMLVLLAGIIAGLVFAFRTPSLPPGADPRVMDRPIETIQAALSASDEYTSKSQFVNAGLILDRAAQKFPDDQEIRLRLARVLIFQERFADALEQFEQAIRIGPALAMIHSDAGTVASRARLDDRALFHFSKAMSIDPKEARYPLYLAMIHLRKGDDAKAMATLLGVVRLDPGIAEAWGTMAQLMLKENNLTIAEQHAKRARELQPASPRWRHVLAQIVKRDNRPHEAIELLQGLTPQEQVSEPGLLSTLAESYGMVGNPTAAAVLYGNAIGWRSGDPELHYQAAVWARRSGDLRGARLRVNMAGSMGHPKAAELLAEIDADIERERAAAIEAAKKAGAP